MKRIHPDDVQTVALHKGAAIGSFNTERAIVKAAQRFAAAPAAPDGRLDALAPTKEAAEQSVLLIAALMREFQAMRAAAPAPVTQWNFEVERDEDGFLKRIVAHAVR